MYKLVGFTPFQISFGHYYRMTCYFKEDYNYISNILITSHASILSSQTLKPVYYEREFVCFDLDLKNLSDANQEEMVVFIFAIQHSGTTSEETFELNIIRSSTSGSSGIGAILLDSWLSEEKESYN